MVSIYYLNENHGNRFAAKIIGKSIKKELSGWGGVN